MPELVNKEVRLHRTQFDFRRSSAIYRGFVGGRGSGKSWVGAYDLICRAKPGRTYLIASPTGVVLNDTTFPTFEAVAKELGVWRSARLSPYPTVTISAGHGTARVRFRSAENPEVMRGPNLSGAWLDEASIMDEDAYKIAIASLREAGEQGWLSATFTPKGLSHWTYERFGKDPPAPNTELFHCRTQDNPFLPREFAATLEGQYVGQFAAQELGGLFVAMEGAEWPAEYFPPSIWFDDWPLDLPFKVMALDPSKGKDSKHGDYSAIVSLGMDTQKNLYVDADLARRPSPRIVEDGLRIFQAWGPQAFAIEINAFQELLGGEFARVARELGLLALPLYGITNTIKKEVRIRQLGPLLAQRRIRFKGGSRGAKLLVQQLRDFPTGDHDDGPDALQMAMVMLAYLLGGRKNGPGQPKVLSV